jgi:hypothetical protein
MLQRHLLWSTKVTKGFIYVLKNKQYFNICQHAHDNDSNMEIKLTDLEVYFHVVLIRLTLVNSSRLFFKAAWFWQDKTCCIPFIYNKESAWETCKSVDDLDSFLPLPTDSCYQLTVATYRQKCQNIYDASHQNLSSWCESILASHKIDYQYSLLWQLLY